MNKDKIEINEKSLDEVTGGTENAPFLPPESLKPSEYSGMFPTPQSENQMEFHIYNGKVADPDSFIAKLKTEENE